MRAGTFARRAHARHEHVHCLNGAAVIVGAHVEGLDVLGVVVDDHGLLEHDVGEVALVLGAHVHAPRGLDGELGLLEHLGAAKDLNGLRVGEANEVLVDDVSEPVAKALLDALVEELDVGGAVLEHVRGAVLEVILGQRHVLLQTRESALGIEAGMAFQGSKSDKGDGGGARILRGKWGTLADVDHQGETVQHSSRQAGRATGGGGLTRSRARSSRTRRGGGRYGCSRRGRWGRTCTRHSWSRRRTPPGAGRTR